MTNVVGSVFFGASKFVSRFFFSFGHFTYPNVDHVVGTEAKKNARNEATRRKFPKLVLLFKAAAFNFKITI